MTPLEHPLASVREALADCLSYIDVDNLTMQTKHRAWKNALTQLDAWIAEAGSHESAAAKGAVDREAVYKVLKAEMLTDGQANLVYHALNDAGLLRPYLTQQDRVEVTEEEFAKFFFKATLDAPTSNWKESICVAYRALRAAGFTITRKG